MRAGADRSAISPTSAAARSSAQIGAPGRHIVQNALAVLGAAELAGADIDKVVAALATLTPESGRGRRHRLGMPGGAITPDRRELQCQSGVDAGGDRAARRGAGDGGGRRIAVLGDMLELGDHSAEAACRRWPN